MIGSVGLAGSANIGQHYAMFEAISGSAPDIAGKGIANPSGLLNAAIMMLRYLQYSEHADLFSKRMVQTLEDGVHTSDIYSPKHSRQHVSTQEFAQAVVERLGQTPQQIRHRPLTQNTQASSGKISVKLSALPKLEKEWIGVDLYIVNSEITAEHLAESLGTLKRRVPSESYHQTAA